MLNYLKKYSRLLILAAIIAGETGFVLAGDTGGIQNPIAADDFNTLLTMILDIVVDIGFPLVVLGIIFVGFKYIHAQGNPGQITQAHQAFLWVMVGAALVLGAKIVAEIVKNTTDVIKGG